jgi:hypothetical protein
MLTPHTLTTTQMHVYAYREFCNMYLYLYLHLPQGPRNSPCLLLVAQAILCCMFVRADTPFV